VKRADWRWYATGPGHAVRLRHGPHAGRLLVPANHSVAPPPSSPDDGTEDKYYSGHAFFSDDDGTNWRLGFVDETPDNYVNPNESTAAELPNGRVYLNARNDSDAPAHRVDAYSDDGGETLDPRYRPQGSIHTPVVQGSVLQLSTQDTLLYSGPADPARRAVMSIRTSHDHGTTWQPGPTISELPAAYSDLIEIDDRTIGILYETGDSGPYERIEFRQVRLS
jgi:sialidase-1